MGKMVRIALIKRLTNAPPEEDDPRQVDKRDSQDKKREQHCPAPGVMRGVKVRQYGQHGQQVAQQVAAGVTQKGARAWKVEGQKPQQRAEAQEGQECNQVLARGSSYQAEVPRGHSGEARAKAVHVVHEI